MTNNSNERPPLFKSWMGWYAFVLLFLVLQIVVYYLIAQQFT